MGGFLPFLSLLLTTLTTLTMASSPSSPSTGTCTTSTTIKTSDGIYLQYNQTGPPTGQPILFITGWRQSAAEWRKQVSHFSAAGFRVTTFDLRGQGDSAEPDFGYRVSRLASDLEDLLTQLDLTNLTIVGHSMGCSVTWAWWDQSPPQSRRRIARLVLVDQTAVMVAHPSWSPAEAEGLAAVFTPAAVYDLTGDMANQLVPLVKSMFTPAVSSEDLEWVLGQNRKMGDAHAAELLLDHAFRDWRDVLPRITVPTLMVGGEASLLPTAGVEWIAGQIPGAKSYIFTREERGSHFMFWENPERFNQVVEEFIRQ